MYNYWIILGFIRLILFGLIFTLLDYKVLCIDFTTMIIYTVIQ